MIYLKYCMNSGDNGIHRKPDKLLDFRRAFRRARDAHDRHYEYVQEMPIHNLPGTTVTCMIYFKVVNDNACFLVFGSFSSFVLVAYRLVTTCTTIVTTGRNNMPLHVHCTKYEVSRSQVLSLI